MAVQPQHSEPRAVVDRGVLIRPAPRDLHEFHVDLNAFARFRFLEQRHLPRGPLTCLPQTRQSHLPEDPLDRSHGDPDIVAAAQPQLRPRRPVCELPAGLRHEFDDAIRHAPPAPLRIPQHEALEPALAPPDPPASDRPWRDAIPTSRSFCSVKPGAIQHHQPVPNAFAVLQAHLHIAQSDHVVPLPGQPGCPSNQGEVNLR